MFREKKKKGRTKTILIKYSYTLTKFSKKIKFAHYIVNMSCPK